MVQTLEKLHYRIKENEDTKTGEKVRVIIVDNYSIVRTALCMVVSSFSQIQICASLSSLENVISIAQKTQIDVIILSSISISACIDLFKTISESQISMGIVVIRRCLDAETARMFIKHGVRSLLGEEASEADLAKAITAAATGDTFLDRRACELLGCSGSRIPIHFTRREIEVLSLLKCGESNHQIANALVISKKTVETHLAHIYEKLHINSRAKAILQVQHLQI